MDHWNNLPAKLAHTRANFPGALCEGLRYYKGNKSIQEAIHGSIFERDQI